MALFFAWEVCLFNFPGAKTQQDDRCIKRSHQWPPTYHQVVTKLQNQGYFCDRRVLRSDEELWESGGCVGIMSDEKSSGSRSNEAAARENSPNAVLEDVLGPRLEKAVDLIALESQDIFSWDKIDADDGVAPQCLKELTETNSTEEGNLKGLDTAQLEFVRPGEPFNDDEIFENVLKHFYFLLVSLNLNALKSVAKDFLVKTSRPKTVLRARVFLSFMRKYRAGEDIMGVCCLQRMELCTNISGKTLNWRY